MKKLISIVLVFAFLMMIPAQSLASQNATQFEPITSKSSFTDGEGKENIIIMTILGPGKIHSEHYIDGQLFNKVDANTTDGENIKLTIIDENAKSTQMNLKASDFFTDEEIKRDVSITPMAYSYAGRINYKTYYDPYTGAEYNYKLSIYQQQGSAYNTYKTLNAAEGSYVNVIVSSLAAVLALICPALAVVSESLLAAAAYAAGVAIVAGKIQAAISERYYVRTTPYDIRAEDTSTNRSHTYQGEAYRVYLDGGGYSSSTYYDGYMPWNSTAVAYWMYCDFWDGNSYPGVLSFS